MVISLLSRVLGFAREILLSYYYGASNISDAYFIAMTIPVVIFSFIGTSISTGFIPMFNKVENEQGETASLKFTNGLITILFLVCTVIFIFLELFTEPVVKIFASGFQVETLLLATQFTRITVLGIYFIGVIYILTGYLQIKNKFMIPALMGFIYNVIIISSIYMGAKINLILLSLGVVIAGLFQVIFLLVFAIKEGFRLKPNVDFNNRYIKNFVIIALPLIFGMSISEINVLIDKTLASRIAVGGISALNYADRLNSFILSTVAMSISVVVYPYLSKVITEKRVDEFKKVIAQAMVSVSILLIPATIGSVLFSKELIRILFTRGAFDLNALNLTSAALLFYSMGMVGMGLREILSKVFYAMQDTKTPVINAAIGMIINIILNLILSRYLGIGGLALATSISATVTMSLLMISLRKKIGSFGLRETGRTLLKILIASLIMGFISKLSYNYLALQAPLTLALCLSIIIGVAIYLGLIVFMKIEIVDRFTLAVRQKMGKKR